MVQAGRDRTHAAPLVTEAPERRTRMIDPIPIRRRYMFRMAAALGDASAAILLAWMEEELAAAVRVGAD